VSLVVRVRRAALALVALCTGCSAVLGFHDATSARGLQGDPCDEGAQTECASGLSCQHAHCISADGCGEGGCSAEGGVGPASSVVASFVGEPGGLVVVDEYVYYAHDSAVYGCTATQPCNTEQIMYSQAVDPRPRGMSLYGNLVAWTDPVAGKISYCYMSMLNRCNMAFTLNESGVRALAPEPTSGDLYFVNAGAGTGQSSDLRVHTQRNLGQTRTIATLPATSALVSLVTDGSQRQFVQLGRAAYSVVTPVGADAGPSVVHALAPEDVALVPPATAAILVAARRVIWTRGADQGNGMSQCPIVEGETACDPATIEPFAGAGDDVTAAASTADTVVWATRKGSTSDVFSCRPTPSDFSERACAATVLAAGLVGRISAIAIEPKLFGPDPASKRVFFVLTEPAGGKVSIQRTLLP
jgi:hypothetical protein